jgi:polyhydroxybutyrate depolymerase
MLRLITALFAGLVLAAVAGCGGRWALADPNDQDGTLAYGGVTRSYVLHVPPDGGSPAGLVVNLHGGGGDGQAQERLTNFDAAADRHGFVVVYPDGVDGNWADGRGASQPDRSGVDDVGFLVALAEKLEHDFGISPGNVFATGMSNGGFMSNRLGCARADVFAAIAPVAGTLGVNVDCAPSRPIAVLEVHGTADPLVPFNGGPMTGCGGGSTIVSAPAMVALWRKVDGCEAAQNEQTLPDAGDGTQVHRITPVSCPGADVVFYQVDNGGHTWPGGLQYLPKAVIGPTSRAFDASETIALFFATHGRS